MDSGPDPNPEPVEGVRDLRLPDCRNDANAMVKTVVVPEKD